MVDLGRGLRNALAKISGAPLVDEKAVQLLVKELQKVLISNDVEIKLVFELSKRVKEKALDKNLMKGISVREHVVKVVYDELLGLLGQSYQPSLNKQKIMLVGLFGSGKTTACAKLAHYYKTKGLTTALIACDVERPAAYEQLEQLSKQANSIFYGIKGETDVKKIIKYALESAKEDVLILDSAGRSAFDERLSTEIKDINDAFNPDSTYLTLSADIGQVAGRQAEQFNEMLGIKGVIVTKLDGSGKGGGALSAVSRSSAKVAFIGTGEKIQDIKVYNSEKFVGQLLGFADLEALMEKMKTIAEEQNLSKNIIEDKFTFKTFAEQLKATKKMGPLKNIFSMMGAPDVPTEALKQGENKIKQFEAIINSMTPAEREDAKLLKKTRSRMERIAKGSGTNYNEVRKLISEFEKMEKTLKGFQKNRGMKGKLQKMLQNSNLKIPGM